MPHSGSSCPARMCDGSGLIVIVDIDGEWIEVCFCIAEVSPTPPAVAERVRVAVLAEVARRRERQRRTGAVA